MKIRKQEISLVESKIELLNAEIEEMTKYSKKAGCQKEFKSDSITSFTCGGVGGFNHFCSKCAEKIRGKQTELIGLYEKLNLLIKEKQ